MLQPDLVHVEVLRRHKQTHAGYIRAQRQVSIAGMRQIIGNTIIAFGSHIYGVVPSCQDATVVSGQIRDAIRSSERTAPATPSR